MRTITFTNPRDPDRCLHVETPLGIVNIRVGLIDREGHRVDSIEIIPNRYAGEPFVLRDGHANTRLIETGEDPGLITETDEAASDMDFHEAQRQILGKARDYSDVQ